MSRTVLLIAPEVPPYGGMALQANLLQKFLREDGNLVVFFPSNFRFPKSIGFLERLPYVRTCVRFLLTWAKLRKAVQQADVIHVLAASWFYFFAVVAPATILGQFARKRVVLNYRGGDAEPFFRRFRWAVTPVFRMADVITAPSPFLADLIQRYFKVPVEIVRNILDSSVFVFRERTVLRPRMVVARHLEPIYGIESVLKAFQAVQQRHPDATLAVVGTGSQESFLRTLVRKWDLREVQFLGHVEHQDLPAVYNQYDIFLNGSRVDNFPGALLEASAAGLAVVSTAAGGIPFMYENDKNALLVRPGDWVGLANAVETLLQDLALAQQLIRSGRELASSCQWADVRRSIYRTYGLGFIRGQQPLI